MKKKIILSIFISLVPLALSIALGSVSISPKDAFAVSMHHIFGRPLDESISAITDNIFWQIRAPRALTAFLVGALLSVAGAVMQASLQNPLASSYTLGVSSGASLGAGLMIVSGIQIAFLKTFSLPIAGFIFAVITVLFVINLSAKIDHNLHNQTIILLGMVISLFVSAIITLLVASFPGSVIPALLLDDGFFLCQKLDPCVHSSANCTPWHPYSFKFFQRIGYYDLRR